MGGGRGVMVLKIFVQQIVERIQNLWDDKNDNKGDDVGLPI